MLKKVFGELKMTWLAVAVFAVGAAIITSVFLLVPVFENTSFERMGIHLEAWILLAVIIMSNCQKPLESAMKTFVFFLISQPLIYLIQVPFNNLGWGIFGYYKYWFIWTLLTFPGAFIGWYITKKNWLSLAVLMPVLGYLTYVYVNEARFAFSHFPYHIVTVLFCITQVILYLYLFTPEMIQKAIGIFSPLICCIIYLFVKSPMELNGNYFLPEGVILSDNAVIGTVNNDDIEITLSPDGAESMVYYKAHEYGDTDFNVKDKDKEYTFTLHLYEDNEGHSQVEIYEKK